MERVRPSHLVAVIGMAICLGLLTLSVHAQQKGKKEYAFRGTVEKVDAKAKTLTVNNEKIEGWMMSMSMTYDVGNPEIIDRVKAGNQITAKVYEGDFKKLYEVKVVAPPKK